MLVWRVLWEGSTGDCAGFFQSGARAPVRSCGWTTLTSLDMAVRSFELMQPTLPLFLSAGMCVAQLPPVVAVGLPKGEGTPPALTATAASAAPAAAPTSGPAIQSLGRPLVS